MSVTALHQVLHSFVHRDAQGNHALQVQSLARKMGLESEIYAKDIGPEHASISHSYERYRPKPGAWLMYQASTGSPMAAWFAQQPGPKLVNYHNVTPPSFFEPWEPRLADESADGRRQIAKLAGAVDHAVAVSRYNESELVDMGYRSTSTAPLLLDTARFTRRPDPAAAAWFERLKQGGGVDLLFHGRIVPNKAQHDLVKVLVAYRQLYDPKARLHLTGGVASGAYHFALRRLIAAAGLWEAVDLAGSVSDEEMTAYLNGSDVYVSASEHEGFGAPLLEAMHAGLPIVAYASTAVPETVGDAAVLVDDKDPVLMAGAIHRVVTDAALRAHLVEAGRRRLAEMSLEHGRARMRQSLEAAFGGAP